MTEDELNQQHGPRLAEVLGENYREHPAYVSIVREVVHGTRTLANILADFTEGDWLARKRGW